MQISDESAMRIVSEISSIIQYDVNVMNPQGVIIASTDPERIGTVHAGAQKVLELHLDELSVTDSSQYPGTKPGINLPIVVAGETVGCIGITGKEEEVRRYGRIIKKMTEIMIQDTLAAQQKHYRAARWNKFMEEWLFIPSELRTMNIFEEGKQFGVDVNRVYHVFVMSFTVDPDLKDEKGALEHVESRIRSFVCAEHGGVYYKLPFKYVCLLPSGSTKGLRHALTHLRSEIISPGVRAFIGGADGDQLPTTEAFDIQRSYFHASKALESSLQSGVPVVLYDDMGLNLLISELSQETCQAFMKKLFRGCTKPQIRSCIEFLRVYFQENGSLQRVASALIMHKNTVQYTLHKIERMTGLDPRLLANAAIFQLAIAIYLMRSEDHTSPVLRL